MANTSKKNGAARNWKLRRGVRRRGGSVAVLILIALVANERAGSAASGCANEGSSGGVARLVANDGSGSRAEQGTGRRATLGVRAGGCRAIGEGQCKRGDCE